MRIVLAFLLFWNTGWLLSNLHAAIAARPNIVVILADDLGYGDVHCYAPNTGKIPTPNIDRLASRGMRFTDAHSSSAVCSPSRYALLTGRYHWRTGKAGIVPTFGSPMIAPERLTVASLLKAHGYQTAAIGKWHLGWDWPIPKDKALLFNAKPISGSGKPAPDQKALWEKVFSQSIPGGPTSRGFSSYFGTDVPNWPPYCFIENDRTLGIPSTFLDTNLLGNNLASLQGPALPEWKLEQILPQLGDRACAFIKGASSQSEPFFLYLPLTSPHTPLSLAPGWQGKSKLNTYADFVMQTDATVGQVLDAIDQSGCADKTLVLFTSDNGCAPYIGAAQLEKMGHFPSGPLRGYKSDVWEGGHRIPFIVQWPGIVKPGSVCHQLTHQADLLATCAAILGTKLPENAGEDSFSILPLLRGENHNLRPHAVSQSSSGLLAIRQGAWKLIFGQGSGGWSKGNDSHPGQLYNLETDLGETTNLYANHPEMVAKLTGLMQQIMEEGRSTAGPRRTNDIRLPWNVSGQSPPLPRKK